GQPVRRGARFAGRRDQLRRRARDDHVPPVPGAVRQLGMGCRLLRHYGRGAPARPLQRRAGRSREGGVPRTAVTIGGHDAGHVLSVQSDRLLPDVPGALALARAHDRAHARDRVPDDEPRALPGRPQDRVPHPPPHPERAVPRDHGDPGDHDPAPLLLPCPRRIPRLWGIEVDAARLPRAHAGSRSDVRRGGRGGRGRGRAARHRLRRNFTRSTIAPAPLPAAWAGGTLSAYPIEVRITPRAGLLDPEGQAVQHALTSLEFQGVEDVRVGKLINLRVQAESESAALEAADAMCRRLLANPVTEDYQIALAGG